MGAEKKKVQNDKVIRVCTGDYQIVRFGCGTSVVIVWKEIIISSRVGREQVIRNCGKRKRGL